MKLGMLKYLLRNSYFYDTHLVLSFQVNLCSAFYFLTQEQKDETDRQ